MQASRKSLLVGKFWVPRRTKRHTESSLKPEPAFKSEAAERAFWEKTDSNGYVDWSGKDRIELTWSPHQ
ncbi:MAG: CopG family antitoxin [Betaproteobacteria bacterium]